jgi:outer membrane protein assembly factor BamA
MNFTLAYPVTKKTGDKTESFRFNLGTTFWWNYLRISF